MVFLYVLLSVLFLFSLLYLGVGYHVFSSFAVRGKQGRYRNLRQEGAGEFRDRILKLNPETHFLKSRDNLTLCGRLLRAEKPRGTTVLLLHGYLGNGVDHMGTFVPFYLAEGFDVFLPDHRAHGDSEGRYIGFGELDGEDCALWCCYLKELYKEKQRFLLHGISMGGAAACTASSHPLLPEEVIGVISDCAFSSCREQFTASLKAITPISPKILLPAANFWCKHLAHYDLFCASAAEAVKHSSLPFLFIHGAEDRFVPTEMVETLYAACPDPDKVKYIAKDAKHFVSYQLEKEVYESLLGDFFKRIGA